MEIVPFITLAAGAYLYGSINLALLIGRVVGRIDIREVGTGNAGTANIGRTLGRRWAVPVFFFDLSKTLVPLMLARSLLTPQGSSWITTLQLSAVALAAVLGHCRPVFFHFRGGGGAAAAMGAFLFYVPAEFFIALVVSYVCVQLFFRNTRFRLGQWVPILFLILTPALTFLLSFTPGFSLELPFMLELQIGGRPMHTAAFLLLFGIAILLLNRNVAREKADEVKRLTTGKNTSEP